MTPAEAAAAIQASTDHGERIVTATGRDTARVHLLIDPGLLVRAITDGLSPVFRWGDGPICGSMSTVGWMAADRDDSRVFCRPCLTRWNVLVDRYLAYVNHYSNRKGRR